MHPEVKQINYTWTSHSSGKPKSSCPPPLPGNLMSSHGPYGQFGSWSYLFVWPAHRQVIASTQINWFAEASRHINVNKCFEILKSSTCVSQFVSLPMGVMCTLLQPPKCHTMHKSNLVGISNIWKWSPYIIIYLKLFIYLTYCLLFLLYNVLHIIMHYILYISCIMGVVRGELRNIW